MRFDAATDYPASATRVAAMFSDPEYVRRKVDASGAISSTAEVVPGADGEFTVTTRRSMPTDKIPGNFRRFVGSSVDVRFVEVWAAPASDGRRTGTLALEILGAPARAKGTVELVPLGEDSSRVSYRGDVTVSIPLVGAPIERAAVGAVQDVIDVERRVGLEWLSSH